MADVIHGTSMNKIVQNFYTGKLANFFANNFTGVRQKTIHKQKSKKCYMTVVNKLTSYNV